MDSGLEPVADDEILMRRIPAGNPPGWFDPSNDQKPSPQAFKPRPGDKALSVYRRKYHTPEEIAPIASKSPKPYYVAMFRAKALRDAGLTLVPRPDGDRIGHVEIPELNYDSRKKPQVEEWMLLMAEQLSFEILGPFPAKSDEG